MLLSTLMSRVKSEASPRKADDPARRAADLGRWIAQVEPMGEMAAGGSEGEKAEALRAWHDAQLEKKEIERRLQQLQAEIGVNLSEAAQRGETVAYFDGWAPRDLPLLPSPIHRSLLTAEELGLGAFDPPPLAEVARLRQLPPPGSLPDLSYLPAPKRLLARVFGRLWLAVGGFLSLPQRNLNQALIDRLERLEQRVEDLQRDRDHLRNCLVLVNERSIANFDFLDQCDRDRLLELHRRADQLRSEWRGDLERLAARLQQELAAALEHKAPGHRLSLLELELASAEMKSQLAWQRLLMAELRQRLDRDGGPPARG